MTDDIKLPELVGTLAQLPEHVRKVIVAYGAACARAAVLACRERGMGAPELMRLDAERYRWLRDSSSDDLCVVRIDYWSDEYVGTAGVEVIDGHHLDSDVDAASQHPVHAEREKDDG